MLEFAAGRYTECCFTLHDLVLHATFLIDDKPSEEDLQSLASIDRGLAELATLCQSLGFDCVDMIERVRSKIKAEPGPKCGASNLIDELKHAILKQFKTRGCLMLTEAETKLYRGGTLTIEAATAFPSSVDEVRHAGECIGLAQYRAGVFHSMNALEPPLRAMARYLSVPFDGQTTWGTAIVSIKDKLDKIERTRKVNKRRANDALSFYGEAAKEFSYFKDAWRNHVMHLRGAYPSTTTWSPSFSISPSVFQRKAGRTTDSLCPVPKAMMYLPKAFTVPAALEKITAYGEGFAAGRGGGAGAYVHISSIGGCR